MQNVIVGIQWSVDSLVTKTMRKHSFIVAYLNLSVPACV